MNTRCDRDELKHQLLLKFYELAKEPEKWEAFDNYHYQSIRFRPANMKLSGDRNYYVLHANGVKVAESGFKTVEIEAARTEAIVAPWPNWRGIPPHLNRIPAVTKQIPDDFHQTCASLFAAWEDWQECNRLTEALQSLSPKAKSVKSPVKVAATPAKAKPPRKAPLASAPVTKSRSTGSSKK